MAAMAHPNIVTVYDAGETDAHFFLVMEFVQGRTLRDILKDRVKLPEAEAAAILMNLCSALGYAHNRNVVHRDVKPGNVIMAEGGEAKLMDFGLARVFESTSHVQTSIIGTPFYMSPEQIRGLPVDRRSDIYSLGAAMYEIVTGDPPFTGGDMAYKHAHEKPVEPASRVPSISSVMNGIILKCLGKKPEERFADTTEILKLLKNNH